MVACLSIFLYETVCSSWLKRNISYIVFKRPFYGEVLCALVAVPVLELVVSCTSALSLLSRSDATEATPGCACVLLCLYACLRFHASPHRANVLRLCNQQWLGLLADISQWRTRTRNVLLLVVEIEFYAEPLRSEILLPMDVLSWCGL